MSPTIVELFENAYKQTRFTQKIKNIDWPEGNDHLIIGNNSQVITEKFIDQQQFERKSDQQKKEHQNRQVDAKML